MPPSTDDSKKGSGLHKSDVSDCTAKFQKRLREQVGKQRYTKWFASKTSIRFANDCFTIGVESPFVLNWMQKEFGPQGDTHRTGSCGQDRTGPF